MGLDIYIHRSRNEVSMGSIANVMDDGKEECENDHQQNCQFMRRKNCETKIWKWSCRGGGGEDEEPVADLDDLFGNESHGRRPPAAIFCRAFAYRYGCIFKGCHVKRQARPLNTFKFINGEGYTPAILYNTSHGVTRARIYVRARKDLIYGAMRAVYTFHVALYDLQFAIESLKELCTCSVSDWRDCSSSTCRTPVSTYPFLRSFAFEISFLHQKINRVSLVGLERILYSQNQVTF